MNKGVTSLAFSVFLLIFNSYVIASSASNLQPQEASKTETVANERLKESISTTDLKSLIEQQNAIITSMQSEQLKLKNKLQHYENQANFSTWVGTLLACVTIIVTVLGVVVAIISFFGFKHVKDSAKNAAEEISEKTASEVARDEASKNITQVARVEVARLLDTGELKDHLEDAVDLIVRSKVRSKGASGFNKYPELDMEDGD